MAQELNSWQFRTRKQWEQKYDWETWMNGKPWRLTKGTEEERLAGKADFSISAESFQQTALNYGRRHRKNGITNVTTELVDDDTVVIRAFRATDPAVAAIPAIVSVHDAVTELAEMLDSGNAEFTPAAAKALRKDSEDFARLVRRVISRMPESI